MKIGLLADTQGSFDVEALLEFVGKEFAGVDEIWHAGDWGSEDVLEGLRRLGRVVVVNGNAPSDARYPTTIEGTIGRWRVGMVHNLDKQRARWAAGYDVLIHGHTHRPGVHDTAIEGEPAQRMVLGAWYEQGSYIQYENGRYELRNLPR